MKKSITVIFALMAVPLFFAAAYGEGNAEKGKVLFNDPQLGGGKAGVSCNSCHPDGKNAAKEADDKGVRQIINTCIQKALQGNPIDPSSSQMDDLVAYLRSVKSRE
jgi:cytochrome c peroxidase